jgi:hypothetical protein
MLLALSTDLNRIECKNTRDVANLCWYELPSCLLSSIRCHPFYLAQRDNAYYVKRAEHTSLAAQLQPHCALRFALTHTESKLDV